MPQVSIQIANRIYELACGDGARGPDHLARRQDEQEGERRGLVRPHPEEPRKARRLEGWASHKVPFADPSRRGPAGRSSG